MPKPRILVHSADDEDNFRWSSDGWFTREKKHTPAAQALMAKAAAAIQAGRDVPDVIKRLRQAGFTVTRDPRAPGATPWTDPTNT